ncbi:Cullin repeat-like-containing domain protein [Mycena leptocephala]|nr:Cullin repeat-like-containing domain protein [Mycena leptocephala]
MAQGEAQEVWETDLKPNIIQILTGSEPLTYATYSEVYSAGLNFILKGKGKRKIDNNDNCKYLYAQVEPFFAEYAGNIRAAAPSNDSALPAYYDAEWDRFSRCAGIIDRLLDYLNKHYVNRLRAEGKTGFPTVRDVAFNSWKTNVFDALSPRLENTDAGKVRTEMIQQFFESAELKSESLKDMRFEVAHASQS